ncbi:MBOAT, membrane-bound O-acyltransferase family-domain-containing protein [Abortiporus biennis]|nr:MBOAT, membrane-bound O-acyltransferase family-domain-containing protein [Abortiporus biennis]
MANAILQAVTDSHGTLPPPTRTLSGGIRTKEGTLYVSKPFRSSTSKKLRAMIAFTPRRSHFDIENESSRHNEFRGFFTLFWISMFLFSLRTYVRSIETNGYALNMAFASMFSEDAITLALSDFVLIISTGLCVPFAKAIANGWIRYYWTGVVIQHVWQTLVLVTAVTWTFNRHWPWVQSGYLTLHSLVLIMKMHSYMQTNGYLSWVNTQAQSATEELYRLTEEKSGSYEKALLEAARNSVDTNSNSNSDSEFFSNGTASPLSYAKTNSSLGIYSSPEVGTPTVPEGTTTSYIDPTEVIDFRKRLNMANSALSQDSKRSFDNTSVGQTTGNNVLSSVESTHHKPAHPHPLTSHPDAEISNLAKDLSEMELELVSSGPKEYLRWPENITYKNFAVYMLIPTLVYELEYPRTDRIRPLYVFEKTVATFGTFALLYTVTESFILPLTPTPDQSFWKSLLDLALPFMCAYLLLFYLIFECICNGFAELSYFADRQFYDDWWNSTSWDEFSRKWNTPVHMFLLRHVYASTMSSYKLSRHSAMFITFLLSAAVHELVMAVVTKKIRMYLFIMQLAQIPLIAIGRIPAIKKNKLFGNIVFWVGLYAGFPLLCVAYVAY